MAESESSELNSSELGTKNYWLSVYERDFTNFKTHGDVGEIWFGEDSSLRIVEWVVRNISSKDKKIADLGCGNGMLLIELAREGYSNLIGVDYCQNAVKLCHSIAEEQKIECIQFQVVDMTSEEVSLVNVDIALDKGTYDAISLDPENAGEKRRKYIENVAKALVPKGLFVITSCNWTESEIIHHFSQDFELMEALPTPKFQFGGKVGNLVSSLVLSKKT